MAIVSRPCTDTRTAERRRVLIVDDHAFFASCLRTLLDNESDLIVCDIALSPVDLAERVERVRPDLLVIDMALGKSDGLEVARKLRSGGIFTPIVLVSSTRVVTAEQLRDLTRAEFVGKSENPIAFLATARRLLAAVEVSVTRLSTAKFTVPRAAVGG